MIITSDSQKRLIEAFFRVAEEHPEQKITFAMIAERAGMSRENAYRNHFRGIPEIIKRIHFLIDNDISTEFEKFTASDDTDILRFIGKSILPFLYDKKDWLRVLYGTNVDSEWFTFLQQRYVPLVTIYLDKIEKNDVIPNTLLSQLIVKNFLSIISVWLTDNNPEPPSLFIKKFIHLLQQSPADMMMQKTLSSQKNSFL